MSRPDTVAKYQNGLTQLLSHLIKNEGKTKISLFLKDNKLPGGFINACLDLNFIKRVKTGVYEVKLPPESIQPIHARNIADNIKAKTHKPEAIDKPNELKDVPDAKLFAELRSRGYSGNLSKVERIEYKV